MLHFPARDRSDFHRLRMIRLPLIAAVVLYHTDRDGVFRQGLRHDPFLSAVFTFFVDGLAGVRVPVFFLIAGYVFFRGATGSLCWFGRKIRSRTRTVLLPLVTWNTLGLVTLAIAQHLPVFSAMLHKSSLWAQPVSSFTVGQFGTAIFGAGVCSR